MQINYTSCDYVSTSVKYTVQTVPAAADTDSRVSTAGQDSYVPSRESACGVSAVDRMKADLQSQQAKLFDQVREALARQGMQVTLGEGSWKIFAEGNFQVDDATRDAARQAVSQDGYWGVRQTSRRIVDFAKALTGGDPAKVEMMRDAFVKGYQAAEKAWGGSLPGIAGETYDAVMKLFDEWADGDGESAARSDQTGSGSFTVEFSQTRVTGKSVSITGNGDDVARLEQSGLLSDVSEPIRLNGLTLSADWCMNEKITVTVDLGGARGGQEGRSLAPGQDGFVPRERHDFGAYDRSGRTAEREETRTNRPEREEKKLEINFFKPVETEQAGGKLVRVRGKLLPTHADGTVTVGLPDGTLRRAKVDQAELDRLFREA